LHCDLAKANLLLMASCFPLQIYTSISNKVVGVLLRARKHKLVDFEGETLFQAS
jgi:thiamine kinase-like enzyme